MVRDDYNVPEHDVDRLATVAGATFRSVRRTRRTSATHAHILTYLTPRQRVRGRMVPPRSLRGSIGLTSIRIFRRILLTRP